MSVQPVESEVGASTSRAGNEIRHGQSLAAGDPELTWGWGTPAGRRRARRRAQMIAAGAALGPGKRALEVGCGTGMFTGMFAETGAAIVAVDISPDLIERARERELPADRVTFLAKPFEECAVDGPFDAVIGSSILHHLEVEPALSGMFELLAPGGLFSFAEPNLLNPQVYLERKLRFLPRFAYVSPDETAFIRWQLAALLSRVGFVDVELTPHDWLHPATPPAMLDTVATIGRWLERTPLVRELAGSMYIRARRPT